LSFHLQIITNNNSYSRSCKDIQDIKNVDVTSNLLFHKRRKLYTLWNIILKQFSSTSDAVYGSRLAWATACYFKWGGQQNFS